MSISISIDDAMRKRLHSLSVEIDARTREMREQGMFVTARGRDDRREGHHRRPIGKLEAVIESFMTYIAWLDAEAMKRSNMHEAGDHRHQRPVQCG
jgi:hypothetical protein